MHITIDKAEMSKIPMLNPLFNGYLEVHSKFVLEKWFNLPDVSIQQKNCKIIALKGNII